MPIDLDPQAPMKAYQTYIHELEALHGWLDVDLVHNCFLMGEEVGELFKAVRKIERLFEEHAASSEGNPPPTSVTSVPSDESKRDAAKEHVGEEIVDVMNYLIAIANRLDIDIEDAFRKKNARNQERTWS